MSDASREADRREALTEAELLELEERFDPETRFRPLAAPVGWLAAGALFVLACYHTYTAGYGIPQATTHRGTHLAFTLGLTFLAFAARGRGRVGTGPLHPFGLPVWDWALAAAGVVSALYVPWIFEDLAFRVGDPLTVDVVMGTVLIVVLLEATRRAMGWPLPVIACLFMAYAYFGRSMPGVLTHPGASWEGIVNHLYLTSQGIYGTALGVISTYVFHFVLFGVLATRIGLGQLFIDLASALAGRFAGGPAKVSVLSSAMLGSISGSSIANTVTTGALTIPAMVRIGYPRHFAAAVEAASSTGGQITPPVMGAVAFLMIEYLGVPLTTILTAALVPAFMHFFGVLVQVHMEARRRGLRGLTKDELPVAWTVFKAGWLTTIPLILLVAILLSGYTPYLAAFWGIVSCVGVLAAQNLWRKPVVDAVAETARGVWDGFVLGAKYSLAVTAAAALVGIVIGVVTLTGVGFKIAYMVTSVAAEWAASVSGWLAFLPFTVMSPEALTLLFTLVMTAIVCVLMGCGIPTTANYLIMIAGRGAHPGAARRRAARGALLRLLLRGAGGHHAARGARGLRRGRHRGGQTRSRRATPRSGSAWARRSCPSSSRSRPRCSSSCRASPGASSLWRCSVRWRGSTRSPRPSRAGSWRRCGRGSAGFSRSPPCCWWPPTSRPRWWASLSSRRWPCARSSPAAGEARPAE